MLYEVITLKYDIEVNDQQALVFQSTQGIPFFEIPKTSLQLRKVPGNQILVANLPNPAPGGAMKQISGNERRPATDRRIDGRRS